MFWIKSINGTSIVLQLAPKKFEFHARVKKCFSDNFSERVRLDGHAMLAQPSRIPHMISIHFFVLGS